MNELRLTPDQIREQTEKTLRVIEQRSLRFGGAKPSAELKDRSVIIVDDGLASGYTMVAAIRWVKKMAPNKVIVAVPTGSERTVHRIVPEADKLICLNVRSGFPFAVADAYGDWYDLSDNEVLQLLRSHPGFRCTEYEGSRAFNPQVGDWFWLSIAPDGKVQASGKVDACIQCHIKAKMDYVFTKSRNRAA